MGRKAGGGPDVPKRSSKTRISEDLCRHNERLIAWENYAIWDLPFNWICFDENVDTESIWSGMNIQQ
jgi:hypothetical protein